MEWTAEKLKEISRVHNEQILVEDLVIRIPEARGLPEKLVIMMDMVLELKYLNRFPLERELFYDFNDTRKVTAVEEDGYETLKEDLKDPDFWDMIVRLPPQVIYQRYQITPPK